MNKTFNLAAGVRADFEELLRRFQKTKCVRFEEFSMIWRDMKLSYIFSGHENRLELLTFSDECLVIALSYCLPPHSFQWRTGGLYLLYSLYFKQPNVTKAKIRVTQSQWREILTYMEEVVVQQHHDINFIYWKLRQHNAFSFVAFPKQLAPYLKSKHDEDGSRCFSESSALKDMIDEDYCTPMEEIHQSYLNAKKELYPNDPSLSMLQEDLLSIIVEKIDNFEQTRLKVVDGYLNEMEKVEEKKDNAVEEDDSGQNDIGIRRSRLKKRIMSKKPGTSQSRRHRAVESEVSDTSREKAKRCSKKTKLNLKNNPSDGKMEVDKQTSVQVKTNEDESMDVRLSMPTF